MTNLNVTADNFAVVRETLKAGESVNVNSVITLVSFVPNKESISVNGKKVRTPFYYVTDNNEKLTSYQLKERLNIEAEKKGKREETTFEKLWAQLSLMLAKATSEEIENALKAFQEESNKLKKAEEERRKREEEEERKEYERLKAKFEAKKGKGKNK